MRLRMRRRSTSICCSPKPPRAPTPPPAHLAVVRVGADQPWQKVVEARGLDLQAALMGSRVLRKDLQDHLGAVEHARLELAFQVALLARAQTVVADDQIEGAFQLQLAKF